MTNLRTHIIVVLIMFGNNLLAQVDMMKYTTEDLFEVKPIISEQSLISEEKEVKSQLEIEVDKGMKMWQEGQLDDALDYFTVLAEDYVSIPNLYYIVGYIQYDKGAYVHAVESMEQVLKIDPLFLDAKFMIANIYLEQGDIESAESTMKSLTEVPEFSPQGYYGLGMVALKKGLYGKSASNFRKSIRLDSTYQDPYIPLVNLEVLFFRDFKKAKKRMDFAVKMDSTWQQARIIRSILGIAVDEDLEAFNRDIEILLQQDPTNFHFYSIKGFLEMEFGNYHGAVENFRKGYNLEVDTTQRGAYQFSSKLTRDLRFRAALNYYAEVFRELDAVTTDLLDRGICYYMDKKYSLAIRKFDSAAHVSDKSVSFMFLGVTYETSWNSRDKAMSAYTRSLTRDSINVVSLDRRGHLFLEKEMYKEAINDYTKLISIRRRDKMPYKRRGMAYMRVGLLTKSYRDLSTALVLDTTDTDLYYNRGTCTYHLKHYKESAKDFAKIISITPGDGESYFMLHKNYMALGDTLKSISYLDSASKYRRYNEEYHLKLVELGESYSLSNVRKNGHDRLVRYFSQKTKHRIDRGKFYLDLKDYESAKKDFDRVIKHDKTNGEAYYYLAIILGNMGDVRGSERALNRSRKLGFKK